MRIIPATLLQFVVCLVDCINECILLIVYVQLHLEDLAGEFGVAVVSGFPAIQRCHFHCASLDCVPNTLPSKEMAGYNKDEML